jgi:hypothetical protein
MPCLCTTGYALREMLRNVQQLFWMSKQLLLFKFARVKH